VIGEFHKERGHEHLFGPGFVPKGLVTGARIFLSARALLGHGGPDRRHRLRSSVSLQNKWGYARLIAPPTEAIATTPETGADLVILLDFVKVIDAFLAFILLVIAYSIADHFNWRHNELFSAGVILIALTLVRLFTDRMKNRFWAKILAMVIWGYAFLLASLSLFNLIDIWQRFLQGIDFQFGKCTSLLNVNRAFFLVLALYWVSVNLRIFFHFWLTVKSGVVAHYMMLYHSIGALIDAYH
jgi:hypothetical protein